MTSDPIAAVLDQLAAHRERIENLDQQVRELTAQLAQADSTDENPDSYQPSPAPRWWKLEEAERREAISRLSAWVDQVYRPGYGHLAAMLGPCWETHDLCLYGLDILSNLWSVLYLQPERSAGRLSAQAEYQTRILPALAEQLMIETTRCGHTRTRTHASSRVQSAL